MLRPPMRMRAGLLAGFVACGPRASQHRRVVDMPPVAAAATVEAEQRVYEWHTGARMFDAQGPKGAPTVLWRVDLGSVLVHPLVTDGERICGVSGGDVFCLDVDGNELWRAEVAATGGVGVREAGVLATTRDGTVVDLDLQHGTITATHDAGGQPVGWALPLRGELVWVTDEGEVRSDAGWAAPSSDSAVNWPAADGLHIYFSTVTGEVVAASRARARWRSVLPGPIVGGLVAVDGLVYASYAGSMGRPGGVAAIAADTGTIAWRMPLAADPATGPALARVLVVPNQEGDIVGLDPVTGDLLWRAPVAGVASTTAALGEFGVYVGNADGRLHRFDPDDGGEIWAVDLGATPSASPVVVDGRVVVGLTDGTVVAVGSR